LSFTVILELIGLGLGSGLELKLWLGCWDSGVPKGRKGTGCPYCIYSLF